MDSRVVSFFTQSEQGQFDALDPPLRNVMGLWLEAGGAEGREAVRLALDIIGRSNLELSRESMKQFFSRCEQIEGRSNLFRRIKAIVQSQRGDLFFAFAYAQSSSLPPSSSPHAILDHYEKGWAYSESAMLHVPPYFNGGKEQIDNWLHAPHLTAAARLTGLLNFEGPSTLLWSHATDYLKGLPGVQRFSLDLYSQFVEEFLNDLALAWLDDERCAFLKLVVVATSHPTKLRSEEGMMSDLQQLFHRVNAIRDYHGEAFVLGVCAPEKLELDIPLDRMLSTLKKMGKVVDNYDMEGLLNRFVLEGGNNQEFTSSSISETSKEIETLFSRFSSDPQVAYSLPRETLEQVRCQYERVIAYCLQWEGEAIEQLVQRGRSIQAQSTSPDLDDDETLQLLALGRLAVRRHFMIYPHNTQIAAILGLFHGKRGALAQIKTGEGKSLVTFLLAFVLAMKKRSIDLISSSRSLAKRDQKKFASLYDQFGIPSSHTCRDDQREEDFKGQIIYGTAHCFEFALMREMIYFKAFFVRREWANPGLKGKVVIVDEVDNMTLDTMLNWARIAWPSSESHSWIYPLVLQKVKELGQRNLSPSEVRETLENFEEGRFKAQVENLADRQLEGWISAARAALERREEEVYVLKEYDEPKMGKRTKVVIVDQENTGSLLEGCRWGGGIHQMVEAKHGLPIEQESLTPLSYSHTLLYQRYDSLYGVTGTLGSPVERDELRQIYGVDLFDVPPHLPSKRVDAGVSVYKDPSAYLTHIFNRAQRIVQERRPLLVICHSIAVVNLVSLCFRDKQISHQLFHEMQDEGEEQLLARAGLPQSVTLATLTAARGTDIILSPESLSAGGLHVMVTFYPKTSERMLSQMIGRAGRQGQPGSSEVVALEPHATYEEMIALRQDNEWRLHDQRIALAGIQRYVFPYVDRTYGQLAKFHTFRLSKAIVTDFAGRLSDLKLLHPPQIDLSHFSEFDQELSTQAIKLLTTTPSQVGWSSLLKQIGSELEHRAIEAWTTKFYAPFEARLFIHQTTESRWIDTLYKEAVVTWEKLIDPSGTGFIAYLKHLTGIDFSRYLPNLQLKVNFESIAKVSVQPL